MNKNLLNLSKIFFWKKGQKIVDRPSIGTRAVSHWKLLIGTFLLCVPIVFGIHFFMYRNIERGDFSPVPTTAPAKPKVVTAVFFEETAAYFDMKGAAFDSHLANPAISVDPSR